LDANILIRSVLGRRVRNVISNQSGIVGFVVPVACVAEAERGLKGIYRRRGLPEIEAALALLDETQTLITVLPQEHYSPFRDEALARIGRRDPDDWHVLAAALAIDCPIWTEDHDFFGTGVATWTTDRVELFFRNL
jgi:predicted nucleic acid-binding protein